MNRIKQFLLKALWQDPNYEVVQMPCPEITIPGVDKDWYAKLLAEATAAGAKFEGTSVQMQGFGFDWNYDGEALVLHVTCTRKPFYVSCAMIEQRIRELVANAKGAI